MENDMHTPEFRDLADETGFVKDTNESIIKVIGVGGGGNNAVNYMYAQKIPYINFVVCNTDRQDLKMSPIPTQLLLGRDITNGLGAGNVPEVGRKCAESSEEDIRKLFEDNTEMVFITAGMGGGTGTGAAPVVARIAKDAGMLTIGIVTVPFFFEGEKKILKALEGVKEMKKHVDALLVINNENLIELYKDLNFFNAFGKADDTLANAARSISEIISEPCYVNVDFQDVKTTLKDSGTAIISTAVGEGEHRITDAINKALHSPLLKAHDIYTSKRLLFKFICWKDSPNPLRAEEIAEINQFTAKLPASIDVKWGIGDNPEMGDKVKITVLASGFDMTIRDNTKVNGGPESTKGKNAGDDHERKTIRITPFDEIDTGVTAHQNSVSRNNERAEMEEFYGKDKVKAQTFKSDEMRYVVLKPSQFDDFEVIAMMEKVPAFHHDAAFKQAIDNIGMPETKPTWNKTKDYDPGASTISFGDDF